MSPMEIESIVNMVKAMTEDELKLVAQNMPAGILCDEVTRRHEELAKKIADIRSIIT